MRVISSGLTDVGLKRNHNEDFFACDDGLGLFIVADGMGGHAAGEVASKTAIHIAKEFMRQIAEERELTWPYGADPNLTESENALRTAIRLANNEVCKAASHNDAYSGMGTTVAGMFVSPREAALAHVGDSRIYRVRAGVLKQLTLDHSWVNEQLQKNVITEEEAKSHRWRNVITRALGNRQDLDVETSPVEVIAGDIYLICSDGLSGMVHQDDILRILTECEAETACRELVAQANANGGMDNITAVVLHIV